MEICLKLILWEADKNVATNLKIYKIILYCPQRDKYIQNLPFTYLPQNLSICGLVRHKNIFIEYPHFYGKI